MNFVSEDEVEKALTYLRENASKAAQARANRQHLEDYSRVVKSQIMMEHDEKPVSAQEREAYADRRYIEHLKVVREAIALDEQHRFLMAAAQARLDCWRTQCATERAMRI